MNTTRATPHAVERLADLGGQVERMTAEALMCAQTLRERVEGK